MDKKIKLFLKVVITAKDYGIVSIVVGISILFLVLLLAKAVQKYRERRSKVALNLVLYLGFLVASLSMYLWTTLIQALDPWGWMFYVQVFLFVVVNELQIVSYSFLFRLTTEIWPAEREKVEKIFLLWGLGLMIYLPLSLINDWGLIFLPNNNHDFVLITYLLFLLYFMAILVRGAIESIKAIKRIKAQYHITFGKENASAEASEVRVQIKAMTRIAIFFVGNLIAQVFNNIVDAAVGYPPIFYLNFLLVPLWVLIAFGGFFPRPRRI